MQENWKWLKEEREVNKNLKVDLIIVATTQNVHDVVCHGFFFLN